MALKAVVLTVGHVKTNSVSKENTELITNHIKKCLTTKTVVVQILAASQKNRVPLVEQGSILTTVTLQTKFVACYATNATWL